ncbi:MAG: family 43 glycosylhydrolase [Oscillospiraceae bacterium]|nr:family 43 glycosylhydrolase [Oscillospiraceae bacterium]
MLFTDGIGGYDFAKDPAVVKYKGRYYLYYTAADFTSDGRIEKHIIGIAVSDDMENWEIIGRMNPVGAVEQKGLCAPGAIVIGDKLHLFYQSYGTGVNDSICHAVSTDGVNFERNKTNPIYRAGESWSSGRAIDADVVIFGGRLLLYIATRDKSGRVQMIGAGACDVNSDFSKDCWSEISAAPILKPELDWEKNCIEAAATICKDGRIYMFYGGAYNCEPQQIGVAVSQDGVNFTRLSDRPFFTNGSTGEWNSRESGHPYVFGDDDGRIWLFYQGCDDNSIWRLSKMEIAIENGKVSVLP